MKIYADSSFLVSLYSRDANHGFATRTMQASRGRCLVNAFGELEVRNAFELRVFRKEISVPQARAALIDFENDLQQGILQLQGLSDSLFARARRLSQKITAKLGTRAADLLHVAAALEFGADYLYSFDEQQRKLARSLHLKLN